MVDDSIEKLPLHDKFTNTERLTRELVDHLERGFLPKVESLSRLLEPDKQALRESDAAATKEVKDVTVRNLVKQLLDTDDFTDQLYEKTGNYFSAIDQAVSRIMEGD